MAQVRLFLSFLIFTLIAGAILSPGADAQSVRGWKLCNKTSYVIEAAVARPDGKGLIVEGWTKLAPGTCELALKGPLEADIHFLYARSSEAHRGGSREWGGEYDLCIDPTGSFTTESQPDCAAWGMEPRGFRPVLIQRRSSWNTTFTETDTYTLEMASAAGVQRLLEDAGVYSGAIDGRLGPRTRAAITEFLKDKGLPANTSDTDLIDLLEQVAKSRAREVGFTLCNRTKKRIWSAIARRRGDDWESRGWWSLAAGGCAHPVSLPPRRHVQLNSRQFQALESYRLQLCHLLSALPPRCAALPGSVRQTYQAHPQRLSARSGGWPPKLSPKPPQPYQH